MTRVALKPLQSYVFHGVTWDYYDRALRELKDQGLHARVTFNDGEMQILTTGDQHELAKSTLARLIETDALEMDIPITCLGSVTCRREDLLKGLEPDVCYYVLTPPPPMASGADPLDLNLHPPPDLAIEIEVSQRSVPKQPIYAALGVDEVWRFDGNRPSPYRLSPSRNYEPVPRSVAFPDLSMDKLNQFIDLAYSDSQHAAVKALRDWVRAGSPR